MADTMTTRSPEEWVKHLSAQLDGVQAEVEQYDNYYAGKHPLAFSSPKFRDAFGGLFRGFADNWCQIVVDAPSERMNVEGFRLGADQPGDAEAWRIWQANQLDADSEIAHTEAFIDGRSFVIVWDNPDDPATPEITIEDAAQVTVAYRPGSRRIRAAALKRWVGEDGHFWATLYLPEALYKFRSANRAQAAIPKLILPTSYAGAAGPTPASSSSNGGWLPREVPDEVWPLPNRLGVVPVVPLVNRPRLGKPGESELSQVIPIQNAVNKLVADMLVASEFGAFRQRWATGIDIPRDPETNKPMEPFKAAIDRLWVGNPRTGQDGKPVGSVAFGEFAQTDLAPYVKAIETLVQHIASQTRTPPHYFYLSGQFPSGESLKSAETGLIAKARRKMRHFGEAWEEVMRLAFMVAGDLERASITDSEVLWRDPESRSEAEHTDAVIKLKALGIPDEILWERVGFSPVEIQRMKDMRAKEPPAEQAPVVPTETIAIRA